jgi:23S rRNA U2552 (ribose-2'-O)-methylase RlmE/FtsJ
MSRPTLQQIFNEIGNLTAIDYGANDKGGQIHTYLETYDKLFEPFRDGCTMLEIGLALGDSVKLWDRYFENSTIIGCDISVVFPTQKYKNDVRIIEADATKASFLNYITEEKLDLCIDDSSHVERDQVSTFELLKHKMKPTGIYILEDILNIDMSRKRFESLHHNCEVIDMRGNGRFDNVLIIYRDF